MRNNLFIISGPSGAGEDSIINELEKFFPIERVITTTSRKMRPGESQKNPYYFISRKKFAEGVKKGDFFEYARHYNGQYYGVTNKEIARVKNINKAGIWKIDYKGVIAAKRKLSGVKAVLVSAPIKILEERIRRRGGVSEKAIKERTEYTKKWYKHKNIYDYEVKNKEGKLEQAVKETVSIIKKELKLKKS